MKRIALKIDGRELFEVINEMALEIAKESGVHITRIGLHQLSKPHKYLFRVQAGEEVIGRIMRTPYSLVFLPGGEQVLPLSDGQLKDARK
jgi:hypothetical protein